MAIIRTSRILSTSVASWHPIAAAFGWVMPGLGHILIGEYKRGITIMLTIVSLWTGGLLIGGITVIDKHNPTEEQKFNLWFLGQSLLAPSLVVERLHQSMKPNEMREPDRELSFTPSFGRTYEQGVLYTALAGMLNLFVMLDVLYREPEHHASKVKAGVTVELEGSG